MPDCRSGDRGFDPHIDRKKERECSWVGFSGDLLSRDIYTGSIPVFPAKTGE